MPLLLMDSALADVLALEAVRVFLPDVFEHLRGGVDGLSSASATNNATIGLMDGDKEKAQTNIQLAKDLANVSTVLYTGERKRRRTLYSVRGRGRQVGERKY
jgi:hypothetical protein